VLDLGAGDVGAVVRLLLADAGAEATAVGETSSVSPWGRGSRFVDAATAAGRAQLDRLLDQADVVLVGPLLPHALRGRPGPPPQVARQFADALRVRRPDVVTGLVTAYGTEGPLADRAADSELLVTARAGLSALQAGWHPGPSAFAGPVVGVNAGLLLAAGVLAALVQRARTGRGDGMETSLLAGALATLTECMVAGPGIDMDARMQALSRRASGVEPFYSAYECRDGRWIHLGAAYPAFIARAAAAMGLDRAAPELVNGPGFDGGRIPSLDVRDALYPLIEAAIATRTIAEWLAAFEAADVPMAPVLSAAEFLDDPQAAANGLTITVDSAGRRIVQYGPAIRFRMRQGPRDGAEGDARHRAPATAETIGRDVAPGLPLSGIRVLEVGQLIAAPLATRVLADLGADVVKLEPVDGGDLARRNAAPAFHPLNAGKRAIAVNLKDPRGRSVAVALAGHVDVVIANMRPGAMERLGLGEADLLAHNPRLVVCNSSAFGSTGPYAHRPGVDGLAAAIAGVQLAQGVADGRPVQMTSATTDHATGLLGAVGILIALAGRERGGPGRGVETSLLDAAALMNAAQLVRIDGAPPLAEPARTQYGPSAVARLYATRDGWIAIDATESGNSGALGRVINASLDGLDEGRMTTVIGTAFAGRGAEEWLTRLGDAGVPAAPVADAPWRTFASDPQLLALDALARVGGDDGDATVFTQRWIRSTSDPRTGAVGGRAPDLGEHTADVLHELGFDDSAIGDFADGGVVLLGNGAAAPTSVQPQREVRP